MWGLFAVSLGAAFFALAFLAALLIVPIGSALAIAILHHGSLSIGDGPALGLAVVSTYIVSSGIGAVVCMVASGILDAQGQTLAEHMAAQGPTIAPLAMFVGAIAAPVVLLIDELLA